MKFRRILFFILTSILFSFPSSSQNVVEDLGNKIRKHSWHLLKYNFQSKEKNDEFLRLFGNGTKKSFPYQFTNCNGNRLFLKNYLTNETVEIELTLSTSENLISNFTVVNKKNKEISTSYDKLQINSNFVLLPNGDNDDLSYFSWPGEFFGQVSIDPNQRQNIINFEQIDFDPLQITIKWCKRVLFVNVCGSETKTIDYGPVLSIKDIPENTPENISNPYFGEITDLTAFSNDFSFQQSYLRKQYALTAVIVDRILGQIAFYREGQLPKFYGNGINEIPFNNPIAVKYIGGYIYILDAGIGNIKPSIKFAKINYDSNGNFSIDIDNLNYRIDLGDLNLDKPTDISGFEDINKNVLLISDLNGLHYLEINKNNGNTNGNFRDFSLMSFENSITNLNERFKINDVLRFDVSSKNGYTVIITKQNNELFSFSNVEYNNPTGSEIKLAYHTKIIPNLKIDGDYEQYSLSNLAFMNTEKKWYLTDYTGKLHTLSEEGIYYGGGGELGMNETNGQLYYPSAITPNPILDITDDFRYRYIVANQWGYTTGFKLFAPKVSISDFRVFESLQDQNLHFTFFTTTPWQAMEKARGITFSDIKVNGVSIDVSKWSNQIEQGTYTNGVYRPGDELLDIPESIILNPTDIPNLKRGWNKAYISITIFREGTSNAIVEKEIDFYWLPDSYTPTVFNNGEFKYNLSSNTVDKDGNTKNFYSDFIYKNLTAGNKSVFYLDGKRLNVSEVGNLNLLNGSTFFNISRYENEIANIKFDGSNSKLNFQNGSYICVSSTDQIPNGSYTLPSLTNQFVLQTGYKIGVNPAPELTFPSNSCVTPCLFLANDKPTPSFTANVNLSSRPFIVTVDASNSTYSTRLRWEVERILPNGTRDNYEIVEVINPNGPLNLTSALGAYDFLPCSKYNITLTLGCTDGMGAVTWITSTTASQIISTIPDVNAGPDIQVCETVPTVTLSGFSPLPSATGTGVWTGPVGFDPIHLTYPITNSTPRSTPLEFTYTYTDIYNCTGSDSRTLTVYPIPPTPLVSNSGPVCEKDPIDLMVANSVSGAQFDWTGPSGYRAIQFEPKISFIRSDISFHGIWNVVQTANGCSSDAGTTQVVIYPLPIVTVGGSMNVCINTPTVTLTGNNPLGGTWNGTGVSVDGLFTPSVAGYGVFPLNYSFTDIHGCTNSATQSVTVGPLLDAGPNHEICYNEGLYTISGFSPIGGTWTGTGIVDTYGIFSPTISGLGTFTVTYMFTDALGCFNSISKTILVKPQPLAPEASNSSPICQGGNVNLFANTTVTNVSFLWKGPNGFTSNSQNPILSYVSTLSGGTYTVSSLFNGCLSDVTTSALTTVTVNPLPIVSAGPPIDLCYNQNTIQMTGIPVAVFPATFTWSGDNITPQGSFVSYVSTTTSYNVTYAYTDLNGCTNRSSTTITKNAYPSVSILSSFPSRICKKEFSSVQLVAAPNSNGPYSFQWSANGIQVSTTIGQAITATTAGLYCVTVTNPCASVSACYYLNVSDEPIFTLATLDKALCVSGNQSTITSTLANRNVGYDQYTYSWSSNYTPSVSQITISNLASNSVQLPIQYPGLYTVTIADRFLNVSCLSTQTVSVSPIEIPLVTIPSVNPICYNGSPIPLISSPPGGRWIGNGISIATTPIIGDDFNGASLSNKWITIDRDNWSGSSIALSTTTGKLSLTGRGNGIAPFFNEFIGVYQLIDQTSFDFSVKIESQTNSNPGAQAGIFAANSLTGLSQGGTCLVAVTPENGFVFQYNKQGIVGRSETVVSTGVATYPCWVRLKKTGQFFEAFYRTSTASGWIQIGTQVSPLQTALVSQVALIQSSRTTTASGTATFDDFESVTPQVTGYFTPSENLIGTQLLTYTFSGVNGGCKVGGTLPITVVGEPKVRISTPSPNTICTIAGLQRICTGQNLTALATPSPLEIQPTFSYRWMLNTSLLGISGMSFTPTQNGLYTVTVEDNFKCGVGIAQLNVQINAPLTITGLTPTSQTVCPRTDVTMTNLTVAGSTGLTTFNWSQNGMYRGRNVLNETTPCDPITTVNSIGFTTNQPGDYFLTVLDKDNCPIAYPFSIYNYPTPTIQLVSSRQNVLAGENLTLSAPGLSAYNWALNSGNPIGLTFQWQLSTNGGISWEPIIDNSIYSGTNTTTLGISLVTYCMENYKYRMQINTFCLPEYSTVYNISITNKPTVVIHPINSPLLCTGNTVQFTGSITGWNFNFQWEISTNAGLNWFPIVENPPFSGTQTQTLSISPVTLSHQGNLFRLIGNTLCSPTLQSQPAQLILNPTSVWQGTESTDWFTIANWCNAIPTATRDASISAGTPYSPVINSTGAVCNNLLLGPNANFTLAGTNTLSVTGHWINNGVFNSNNGIINFNGSQIQAISGTGANIFSNIINSNTQGVYLASNASISGVLTLGENTSFSTTGYNFVFLSTGTVNATAKLAPVPPTARFIGNITMQRYIPAKPGLRYVSSAVQGATIQDWQQRIPITGVGGAANGFDPSPTNLNTVFYYDETINASSTFRLVRAPNVYMPLAVGAGYRIFIRGDRSVVNLFGSFPPSPTVLSVTNKPTIGDVDLPISYTDHGLPDDGLCLVGNPYPCEIDWRNTVGWEFNETMEDAFYMWDPNLGTAGQYYSYVGGIATPNRINRGVIGSSSAFFVKARNVSNPHLKITELAKTLSTNYVANFRPNPNSKSLFRIECYDSTYSDETVIHFHPNAKDEYEGSLDGLKLKNEKINIWCDQIPGLELSINTIPKNLKTKYTPLSIFGYKNGQYNLRFFDFESLNDSVTIYLVDKYLKHFQRVQNNDVYSFNINSDSLSFGKNRFELVYALLPNVPYHKLHVNENESVRWFPNPTNGLNLKLEILDNTSENITLTVVNSSGVEIYSKKLETLGQSYFNTQIDALVGKPSGIYIFQVNYNNKTNTQKIELIR